jgi:diguanylate cyclase (GGDEF)-like protein
VDLLLWRWSTAVQVTSLVMIALFFCLLTRSVRMAALRWWMVAWLANVAALGITLGFWIWQPPPFALRFLIGPVYMGLKSAFVVFLVQGAWSVRRSGDALASRRVLIGGLCAYAAAMPLFVDTLYKIGVVQHTVMGAGLLSAGIVLFVGLDAGLPWLAVGLIVRGALAFAEAAAYVVGLSKAGLVPTAWSAGAATFLAAASSFDSAAEWLLALGCVLAISERVQRELVKINVDLIGAQNDLRRLADRDALTGLDNRRALPEVLRAAQPAGATLLFFDLDKFKEVNDRHGHAAGDETLRRFAAGLRECFRPSDNLIRYAGDEFLVVARGLEASAVADRVAALRLRLRRTGDGPPIGFSVGAAELAPGGRPEEALHAADEAMYAAKRGRAGAVPARANAPSGA